MALILNIDTATERGSICLGKDGHPLISREIFPQKNHAALTVPLIEELLRREGLHLRQLDAVAVSGGPGSYTGIRIATATAKGLCYGLDIPLIAVGTLLMMASGIRDEYPGDILFCPMIDARRMDAFTALYDSRLELLRVPAAVTLDENFLDDYRGRRLVIFGTAKDKAKQLLEATGNWLFADFTCDAAYLVPLAEVCWEKKQFEDLAYFEPAYLKSFYTAPRKH